MPTINWKVLFFSCCLALAGCAPQEKPSSVCKLTGLEANLDQLIKKAQALFEEREAHNLQQHFSIVRPSAENDYNCCTVAYVGTERVPDLVGGVASKFPRDIFFLETVVKYKLVPINKNSRYWEYRKDRIKMDWRSRSFLWTDPCGEVLRFYSDTDVVW